MDGLAYIDTSAMVKLVISERQSRALAAAIDSEWPQLTSSEILSVETARAALRSGKATPALVAHRLRSVALLPLTAGIRKVAGRLSPPELRSLDAIHLATALAAAERIGAVITYDKRLAAACLDSGLRVVAPA